jgi:hypothetical protein
LFFAKLDLLFSQAIWHAAGTNFGCLGSAKVEGCFVTSGSLTNGNLRLIANHAGCALVESDDEVDRLRLSLEAARGPRIFLLRCGQAPGPGFIEEAKQFPGTNDSG